MAFGIQIPEGVNNSTCPTILGKFIKQDISVDDIECFGEIYKAYQ